MNLIIICVSLKTDRQLPGKGNKIKMLFFFFDREKWAIFNGGLERFDCLVAKIIITA